MKIQIVSWRDPKNPKAGGAEVCLLEISQRLMKDYGHKVSWFAPAFEGSQEFDEISGVEIQRKGSFKWFHLTALFRFFFGIQQNADFYIEDYHGLSLGLRFYLKKPHLIFVHEVAGPIWLKMWKFPISWIGFVLEKIALRLLDDANFIAVSESTKKDLIAHGIPEEQIHVISEGSNLPAVREPVAKAQRKKQFIFVGRICKMKRVDLLLHAFAELLKMESDVELYLSGSMDPDFKDEYSNLVNELALANHVKFTGFITQAVKTKLLQESLALVSCSMHEGFGLVVVEANSQGTPALTFDIPGYRDLIVSGKNGFMAEFGKVDEFAEQMRNLIRMDDSSYAKLAGSSLEISTQYSWDKTASDVNSLMTKIFH